MPSSPRLPQSQARALPAGRSIEAAALYGAFVLIGAVVFGTLSIHPF